MSSLADHLKHRIEREYLTRGDQLGWRLLYSPPHVLDGARVAFIGLNPGGKARPEDHAEFAMTTGSAYETESWSNCAPGESPLQRQVLALFERIGERPENVLAGNLVPFRSPSWKALKDRTGAIAFGKEICALILARAKPELVITIASVTTRAVVDLLGVAEIQRMPVGWGNAKATIGEFEGGKFVGLPHLSRYRIMTREACEPALGSLLDWPDERRDGLMP